jgi:hypothetical protein
MDLTQKIFWVKPRFVDVKKSFTKIADRTVPAGRGRAILIRDRVLEMGVAYDHARIAPVTDSIWRQLDDSRSWWTLTPHDVNQELLAEHVRDPVATVGNMVDQFNAGRVDAPIIVTHKLPHSSSYSLVVGNLQLMICRSSKIIPKAVFVEI